MRLHPIFLVFALVFLTSLNASADSRWNLNDVTILFPLPQAQNRLNQLLGVQKLLPVSVYNTHPVFPTGADSLPDLLSYQTLRVVGVRIDPEKSQIRMVWQPIIWDASLNQYSTEDRAAHTFYQLTQGQFHEFITEWALLKSKAHRSKNYRSNTFGFSDALSTYRLPLGIHPALLDPELGPTFGQELRQLLGRFCSEQNLVQYTAMELVSISNDWWRFGGMKLVQKNAEPPKWDRLSIPRTKDCRDPKVESCTEDFFNFSTTTNPRTGLIVGLHGQLDFQQYGQSKLELTDTALGLNRSDANRADVEIALAATKRFQNPLRTNSDTIDCVSCHIAEPIQFWITHGDVLDFKVPKSLLSEVFKNPDPSRYNLQNTTVAAQSSHILRALGYFGAKPAVNQRVINESALSAHLLNTRGL